MSLDSAISVMVSVESRANEGLGSSILLVFLISAAVLAAGMIHDTLLGNMGRHRATALDLASFSLSSCEPLSVLRMLLVDGRGIYVLVVGCRHSKLCLIDCELIPRRTALRGLLQAAIDFLGRRIGLPSLQLALLASAATRDAGVCPETGSATTF